MKFQEIVQTTVTVKNGLPALQMSCIRGEARKGTQGLSLEYLTFKPEAAVRIGQELAALGKECLKRGDR